MLILSFWSLFSIAQKSESHYFTELSIGTSIPIGGFASKTYNGKFLDNANGIAKVGIALNIYTGYRINKTFGLVFMAGGSQNKQDSNTFYNYLKKERKSFCIILFPLESCIQDYFLFLASCIQIYILLIISSIDKFGILSIKIVNKSKLFYFLHTGIF